MCNYVAYNRLIMNFVFFTFIKFISGITSSHSEYSLAEQVSSAAIHDKVNIAKHLCDIINSKSQWTVMEILIDAQTCLE